MDVATLVARLAEIHRGRKWILTAGVAATAADFIHELHEWGASDVMLVAGVAGEGELPAVPTAFTRTETGRGMRGIRAFEADLRNPDDEIQAAVDKFDPNGEARVVVAPFSTLSTVFGRPVYGPRPPQQSALEDKMTADALWDAAGVARAPSAIVPVRDAIAASRGLAGLLGSVWVADNKRGWHGGTAYVRWVRTEDDEAAAQAFFADSADRVRVMPFLDGIPCSIHGWVTGNGIAVIRPLEMITLRRTDETGFLYGGMANYWDPPAQHRRAMRAAARAVAEHLRDRVAYTGPYGIDGVLTAAGFLPTELNPRLTYGHASPADTAGFPAGATLRAELEGELDLDAEWLEATLVAAADATRTGRAIAVLSGPSQSRSLDIAFTDDTAIPTDEADRHASVTSGIFPQGSAVVVRFEAAHTPEGPSIAPRAVAALDLARTTWGVDIPPVEAAPDFFTDP